MHYWEVFCTCPPRACLAVDHIKWPDTCPALTGWALPAQCHGNRGESKMCAGLWQSCRVTSTLLWGGGPHRLVPREGLGPAPASPSWQSQCFSAGPVPTLPTSPDLCQP